MAAAVWWFLASFLCIDVVLCNTLNPSPVFKKALEDEILSSDTISVGEIAGDLPTIKYALKNLIFSGKKSCVLENLNLERENSTFSFKLECLHVEIDADYKINGKMNDLEVFGEGPINLKLYNYAFIFDGNYEVDNEKQRVQIKDYTIDANPKSPVHFDLQNMYGDKKKSDEFNNYLNTNWRVMDKALRGPAINGYMGLFLKNVNDRLKQL